MSTRARRGPVTPADKLRTMRESIHPILSQAECGRALGISGTAYRKYETTDERGDALVPIHIVNALMPLMVGKGNPTITRQKLLDISELNSIDKASRDLLKSSGKEINLLDTMYRLELGTFIDERRLEGKVQSTTHLTSLPDLKGDQFCVMIGECFENAWYPEGSVVQCVRPDELYAEDVAGGRCLVAVQSEKSETTYSIRILNTRLVAGKLAFISPEMRKVECELLGVVLGHYTPADVHV